MSDEVNAAASDLDGIGADVDSVAGAGSAPLALAGNLQAHIGRQLRAVYEDLINQPVPERFVKLLDDLERTHAGIDGGGPTKPTGAV